MTTIPLWWLIGTMVCFIVTASASAVWFIFLWQTAGKLQNVLTSISEDTLPKVRALSERMDGIAVRVDRIAATLETQLDTTLPKVQNIVDKVDRTTTAVESASERVTDIVRHTTEKVANRVTQTTDSLADKVSAAGEQIQRIAQHPTTQTVLIGAAAFAAFRYVQVRMQHNGTRTNGAKVQQRK